MAYKALSFNIANGPSPNSVTSFLNSFTGRLCFVFGSCSFCFFFFIFVDRLQAFSPQRSHLTVIETDGRARPLGREDFALLPVRQTQILAHAQRVFEADALVGPEQRRFFTHARTPYNRRRRR